MLDNIWKAHDSSPLQNNFINGIQIHNQNPWFKPMAIHSSKAQSHWQYQSPIPIGNIKAQFLLTTSKPDFYWHYFIKKKKAQDYQRLAKKKYHVKMLPWQKRIMAIILWRNSLRAILRIMFSYYEPMKYMNIILHHDIHNIYLLHSW